MGNKEREREYKEVRRQGFRERGRKREDKSCQSQRGGEGGRIKPNLSDEKLLIRCRRKLSIRISRCSQSSNGRDNKFS